MTEKKPIIHIVLTAVAAFLLIMGIVLDVVLYGVLRNVLDFRFGGGAASVVTEEEKALRHDSAKDVAYKIEEEGMVLLENNGTLPYTGNKKVDLLGVMAESPSYGGQGSSETSDNSVPVSFRAAFEAEGFTVNADVLKFYRDGGYITEGVHGVGQTDFRVKDPDPDLYWDKTSDASLAVVVFGRSSGEEADYPLEMKSENVSDAGKHTLELSTNERKLLDKAAAKYANVIVVLNAANPLECGFLDELYSDEKGTAGNVDACVWIGMPGYHGIPALVAAILGDTDFSGRLTDTYAYDHFSSPAAKSLLLASGKNGSHYSNCMVDGGGRFSSSTPATYVEYGEGIYVGYRYYETAAALGYINFDEVVQYPFGYGKSYASFTWKVDTEKSKIPDVVKGDSSFEIVVDVTNNGVKDARDVVELYLTLDKENLLSGKLNRSATTLVAYEKTPVIGSGKTESVTLKFSAEDIASYDDKAIYSENGSYVIEAGSYALSLRTDSHNPKAGVDSIDFALANPIVYNKTSKIADADVSVTKRPSDLVTANNRMGSYEESILSGTKYGMGVEYLELTSVEEKWIKGTAEKGEKIAPDSLVAVIENGANKSTTNKGYENKSSYNGTVGAKGSLSVMDFGEVEYGDDSWQKLVEQLPFKEMKELILYGGYKTNPAPSVGKEATIDCDGPCGIAFIFRQGEFPGVSFPCNTVVASTWNKDRAYDFGEAVAKEAEGFGLTSWYAPGANLHRTPFGGRNFEYASEDPLVTGIVAAHTSAAATKCGTPTFMKHYALNEQETNRGNNLMTWVTESAARELYLRAFELGIKTATKWGLESEPLGVMTSFNYVGDRWAGASKELCTDYLRTEWGFKGTVVTDYFGNSSYMDAACAIRAGNDMMLGTINMSVGDEKSGDTVYYLQKAAKNILYTYSRSWNVLHGMEAKSGLETWEILGIVGNIVWWGGFAVCTAFCVLKWLRLKRGETVEKSGESESKAE